MEDIEPGEFALKLKEIEARVMEKIRLRAEELAKDDALRESILYARREEDAESEIYQGSEEGEEDS